MDAEWNILYDKLDRITKSGAKVVLSKLPIGDVATQVSQLFIKYKQYIEQISYYDPRDTKKLGYLHETLFWYSFCMLCL